jgi:hypothetical protein
MAQKNWTQVKSAGEEIFTASGDLLCEVETEIEVNGIKSKVKTPCNGVFVSQVEGQPKRILFSTNDGNEV